MRYFGSRALSCLRQTRLIPLRYTGDAEVSVSVPASVKAEVFFNVLLALHLDIQPDQQPGVPRFWPLGSLQFIL